MAKKVFFSFYYKDVADFRANVVRNHWRMKKDRESAGFFDASIWESAKKTGDMAVKRLINTEIQGTSVTCVLVGTDTYTRRWVRYEMAKSFKKGNQLIAVHINSIRGRDQQIKSKGRNPFDYISVSFSDSGSTATLKEWKSGRWYDYLDLDGSSSYRLANPVSAYYRGKAWQFSKIYKTYDWAADNGYNNFSNWIG